MLNNLLYNILETNLRFSSGPCNSNDCSLRQRGVLHSKDKNYYEKPYKMFSFKGKTCLNSSNSIQFKLNVYV